MRQSIPDIALRVQVDFPEDLIDRVADGLLDAAVMYASPSPSPSGLIVEFLLKEKLVMVTTDPDMALTNAANFVAADWGPSFWKEFVESFPETESSGLSFNLGPLALNYVLSVGGHGYFRKRVVGPYLSSGGLHRVASVPEFSYPIYVVSSVCSADTLLAPALAGLRSVIHGNA